MSDGRRAGVKGSKMYDSFINGDLIYLCATLKKVN